MLRERRGEGEGRHARIAFDHQAPGRFRTLPTVFMSDRYHASASRSTTITLASGYAAMSSGMHAAAGTSMVTYAHQFLGELFT